MLLADVFHTLIDHSTVNESTRHDLKDAVDKVYAADLKGLSEEEKENRAAPINRAGAITTGAPGPTYSTADVDKIVARALAAQAEAQAKQAAPVAPVPVVPAAPAAPAPHQADPTGNG